MTEKVFAEYSRFLESRNIEGILALFDNESAFIGTAVDEYGVGKENILHQHIRAFEQSKTFVITPHNILRASSTVFVAICEAKWDDYYLSNIRVSMEVNKENKISFMHFSVPDCRILLHQAFPTL